MVVFFISVYVFFLSRSAALTFFFYLFHLFLSFIYLFFCLRLFIILVLRSPSFLPLEEIWVETGSPSLVWYGPLKQKLLITVEKREEK